MSVLSLSPPQPLCATFANACFPLGHSRTCQCNACARVEADFIEWHIKQHGSPPSAVTLLRIRLGDGEAEAMRKRQKRAKAEAAQKKREEEQADAQRRAAIHAARQERLYAEAAEKARLEAEAAAKKRNVKREVDWRKRNPQTVTNLHLLPGGVGGG